jgi:cardiolipin synthase
VSLQSLGTYWYEIVALAAYAAWAVWVTTVLLLARRPPMATVAWLLALLFLPYIGAFLYFFFGPRRLRRKRLRYAKSRSAVSGQAAAMLAPPANLSEDFFLRYRQLALLAERLEQPAPARATSTQLYMDGDALYEALAEAIAAARHHLHVEYYIWRPDRAGTRLRDALVESARAGVQVRLLLDNVGSNATRDAFFAPIEAAGGEVAWFNRPRLKRLRLRHQNFRTHRKILVADGRVAFTGGMNVTDDHSRAAGGASAWRDTHLRFEGAPAAQLQRVFLDDWVFARGPCEVLPEFFPDCPPGDGPFVQVISSGPDQDTWAIQRVLFNAIANARSSIRLTTPYFVPDEAMLAALVSAALRGVSIAILLPRQSDSRLVTAAARSYYEELARVGIEIWEYGPPMLHAKTSVFDDIVSLVGTANLDNRSFRLNFEVVAMVYSADTAKQLNAQFDADLALATRYLAPKRPAPVRERLLMGAARLFSPLL